MLFVALKIKRAQKFFTYVDLVIARQNETDPSYHMLNQPASTGSANTAAWDRSALVARLCQKPLEQP